jgi:chromate reductase, NAD(P)H dehydrogenase (quinone)
VSGGMLGGSRAQYHLRQIFVFLDMHPINRPEVMVPFGNEKIKNGILVDEVTKQKITDQLHALIEWTNKLK